MSPDTVACSSPYRSSPPTRHPHRVGRVRFQRAAVEPSVAPDLLEPGLVEQRPPAVRLDPPELHLGEHIARAHGELEPAGVLVPERPLVDAGLALDPAPLRLGDVEPVGMEDVERERPT